MYNNSEIAEFIVMELISNLIDERVPGEVYTYRSLINSKSEIYFVSRSKILAVITWIIMQAKAFEIPILINFQYGNATVVGKCFNHILGPLSPDKPGLDILLSDVFHSGIKVPKFNTGNSNGPEFPYIMFSDYSRGYGMKRDNLKYVKIISLQDTDKVAETIVPFSDICN